MKILKTFSIRQKNGKLKYFHKAKCVCGKIFTTRKDSNAKSCGCLNFKNNPSRRKGKFTFTREERIEKSLNASMKSAYHSYNDGDLSFDEFIELSQKNCFYCNSPPINKANTALKQDGTKKQIKCTNIVGEIYYRDVWSSDLGEQVSFIYNGLDRINQAQPHNKNNMVVCCKICNYMKRNFSRSEFIEHIKRIYEWIISKH